MHFATLRAGVRYHFGPSRQLFDIDVPQAVSPDVAALLATERTHDRKGNEVACFEITEAPGEVPVVAPEQPAINPARPLAKSGTVEFVE